MRGIRVIEVGNYMAGPFCGMQLADLGADVVKVENPKGGDLSRRLEPIVNGESGSPLRLGRTPVRLERAGPLLGEHSHDVLTQLGCDEGEIARLVREGCVA